MRPIRTSPPTRVGILSLPGALASAVALSHDVLEVANRVAQAAGKRAPFAIVRLRPEQRLPRGLTALVVPGTGAASAEEVERALRSRAGRWAVRTLAAAGDARVHVATSCASVFFAAEAGLLDGRPATTSWFLAAELGARYPKVRVEPDRMLVESGRCLTGGAALAHADVMLALVERLTTAALADRCASYLLLDRRRSQRPYVILQALVAGDVRLTRAEAWIREHAGERFTIAQLARSVGLGERTFARLVQATCGLSPITLVQRVRVDVARELLERGASFAAVAPQVGYADATALRRVFRRHGRPTRALG